MYSANARAGELLPGEVRHNFFSSGWLGDKDSPPSNTLNEIVLEKHPITVRVLILLIPRFADIRTRS